ncbi:hypothetical protein H8356DRAFT_1716253 [Neocallimastix lanati (nom. inval.)]|jgi:NAD-dependent SIR2 family protein deacetylase|uniref:LIM zinc-binding domain-containing protein n=1 Tax=Neocallimastix californiae TaxID=1754190 RepID=A0A1Y2DAI3_9FUNG|nr:hypothetical protein H8356DRAFT_1716253 [Neocallimastix sp. JGI-2020a]ORY56282.1 hypothetical protein LY90DRAFT_701861 [Neocallimastix californiae]|eukprot:ORY56282.1 hypothetical protein LY90DRAFT_701861 [Neocallimastix californiae]
MAETLNFICPYCNESTKTDERFKYIDDQTYHLKCFNCCNCKEPLQNGKFFFNNSSDQSKLLMCSKCHDAAKPKPQSNGPQLSKVNAGLYDKPVNPLNPMGGSCSNLYPTNSNKNLSEWRNVGSQSSIDSLKNVEGGGSYTVRVPKMSQQQLSTCKCEKCGTNVYENEKHLADGKIWHVNCYRCTKCNTILKGKNGVETVDKKPYCAKCKQSAKGMNYYTRHY